MPLQNKTSVFAVEKFHKPSIFVAPNFFSRSSATSKGSAPASGLNKVHGILIDPGIVPFLTQFSVRESITRIELSPLELFSR